MAVMALPRYDGGVDAISEAIAAIRAGTAYVRTMKESGSWGMRFPDFTGVGFHIVLAGRGWLLTPDQDPRAVGAGDVVLVASGAPNGLSHAPGVLADLPPADMSGDPPPPGPADFEFLCGSYQLGRGQVHHYLQALPDVIVVSPDDERDPQLRLVAELLRADSAGRLPGTEATRPALVDLLLVHALREWLAQGGRAGWPQVSDPAVAGVLSRVHRDPGQPWTVQQLSDAAGLSRTAFTRRFTAALGSTPRDYLASVRLTRGAGLLRDTSAPLAWVARQAGYSTEFAFSAAFRRQYGISPGRFRAAGVIAPSREDVS